METRPWARHEGRRSVSEEQFSISLASTSHCWPPPVRVSTMFISWQHDGGNAIWDRLFQFLELPKSFMHAANLVLLFRVV